MSGSNRLLIVLPAILSGFTNTAVADSADQTDWSGGPGVLGPVLNWSNQFYSAANVEWSSNPGNIQIQLQVIEHTVHEYGTVFSLFSADIDGDGDMDVLGSGSFEVKWWENEDSLGTAWTEHIVDVNFEGAQSMYSADVNGDGYMDILGAAGGVNAITWWENIYGSGTVWIEHTVDHYFVGACCVHSADIDNDGDMDIIGAALTDNAITWWENTDGSGTSWIEHVIDGDFWGAWSVYTEDIDGDGDEDVLGASFGDKYKWWENVDGSGTSWIEHIVDSNAYDPWYVYSEDLDGDGDMDVLGSGQLPFPLGGCIDWWENADGLGTYWIKHSVDGEFNGSVAVYSEDMDNDGDMDVISGALSDGLVSWWENDDGSGTSWIEHTIDPNHTPYAVYPVDIDGDGNTDVLGSSLDVVWWDLTPPGCLESSILDTECSPKWASIDWSGSEPAETDLYFQYRTSDDPGSMGTWSDPIYEPCLLSGLLNRYFQYTVSLETTDPYSTPTLHDISLNWDPLGVEDNPYSSEYLLFGAEPNPACETVTIGFTVPEISVVEFYIFDLSGHLVQGIDETEYPAGDQKLLLDELSPGIYFCRMISSDFTAIRCFVVIE